MSDHAPEPHESALPGSAWQSRVDAPVEQVRAQMEQAFVRGNFESVRAHIRWALESKDDEKRKLAEEYAQRITPDFVVLCFLVFLVMVFAAVSLSYLPR